ncbi:MAG: hypothetical protein LBF28_03480 [Rickettsiales bacterium]|jgi:hypothetical protein|nr:hypothetical protein [Rickettsiales bacterium]
MRKLIFGIIISAVIFNASAHPMDAFVADCEKIANSVPWFTEKNCTPVDKCMKYFNDSKEKCTAKYKTCLHNIPQRNEEIKNGAYILKCANNPEIKKFIAPEYITFPDGKPDTGFADKSFTYQNSQYVVFDDLINDKEHTYLVFQAKGTGQGISSLGDNYFIIVDRDVDRDNDAFAIGIHNTDEIRNEHD